MEYPATLVLLTVYAVQCHAYEHALPPSAELGMPCPTTSAAAAQVLVVAAVGDNVAAGAEQSLMATTTPSVHSLAPRIVMGNAPSCCIRSPMQYGKHMPRVKLFSEKHAIGFWPPHMGITYTATSAASSAAACLSDARGCAHRSDWTDTRTESHVSSFVSAARLHAMSTGRVSPAMVDTAH